MTLTLEQYTSKHNLSIVKEYWTCGEHGDHRRAIVRDNVTNETYYLYFDRSHRKRTLAQQKRVLEIYQSGGIPPMPSQRGWRNVTLDNRRQVERRNKHLEESSMDIHHIEKLTCH